MYATVGCVTNAWMTGDRYQLNHERLEIYFEHCKASRNTTGCLSDAATKQFWQERPNIQLVVMNQENYVDMANEDEPLQNMTNSLVQYTPNNIADTTFEMKYA